MMDLDYYIKSQAGNLCAALHRNINDNFVSVSFAVTDSGDVSIKIILLELTETEKEYIEDIDGEFSAVQWEDPFVDICVEIYGDDSQPLENLVYRRR